MLSIQTSQCSVGGRDATLLEVRLGLQIVRAEDKQNSNPRTQF